MEEVTPTGVLLVNLGTPASPRTPDVRRYLREFLGDPRVLTMPAPQRWLLLHLVILVFRPRKSARAYAKIWTESGSPLLVHSTVLARDVADALGPDFVVELGMRYGEPSIASALDRLVRARTRGLLVVPLFPQYAEATAGSVIARVEELCAGRWRPDVIADFHDDPGFIAAAAAIARPLLDDFAPEGVLLSFHGLPESQLRGADPERRHCLERPDCCDAIGPANRRCYRAQAFGTARALAQALGLSDGEFSVSFQSRLGRMPWIRPYTDQTLEALAKRGVRRLAVLCPSFVADCLETLEEIGIRAREQWATLGGEDLLLVPCVNSHPLWIRAAADMIRSRAADPDRPETRT